MAVKNLSTIRGLDSEHPYVLSELADIHNTLERDRAMCGAGFTGPIKALFQSKAYLKRLAIAVMLFAGQNGTGINAINYYSPVSTIGLCLAIIPIDMKLHIHRRSSSPSVLPVRTLLSSPPVSSVSSSSLAPLYGYFSSSIGSVDEQCYSSEVLEAPSRCTPSERTLPLLSQRHRVTSPISSVPEVSSQCSSSTCGQSSTAPLGTEL